ncbi:hypothetical protein QWJ90_00540 [Microbacterium oryzae]|uniref:hypothetical protein n=1 Tax=Microbacterium oryzae TaxID=743009 RepID=UPI0025AF5B58|nr:hypothetical protein [Microbacterium oryzae]MDN3309416.1 hypothetical protein [Microbacterium oryzae]
MRFASWSATLRILAVGSAAYASVMALLPPVVAWIALRRSWLTVSGVRRAVSGSGDRSALDDVPGAGRS